MTTEEEVIESIKKLQQNKTEIWNNIFTVIMYYGIILSSTKASTSQNIHEELKNAVNTQNTQLLNKVISEGKSLEPFLGNKINHIFGQYLSFFIALNLSIKTSIRKNSIKSWQENTDLLTLLDDKYRNISPAGKLSHSKINEIHSELETDLNVAITERLSTFVASSPINVSGDNVIIGNQSAIGTKNTINSNNKTILFNKDLREFVKHHPIIFIIELIIHLTVIFVGLKELHWL